MQSKLCISFHSKWSDLKKKCHFVSLFSFFFLSQLEKNHVTQLPTAKKVEDTQSTFTDKIAYCKQKLVLPLVLHLKRCHLYNENKNISCTYNCTYYQLHFAISQRTVGGRAYQLTFQFVTIYLNCFKLCNYVLTPLRLLLVSLSMSQWVQTL